MAGDAGRTLDSVVAHIAEALNLDTRPLWSTTTRYEDFKIKTTRAIDALNHQIGHLTEHRLHQVQPVSEEQEESIELEELARHVEDLVKGQEVLAQALEQSKNRNKQLEEEVQQLRRRLAGSSHTHEAEELVQLTRTLDLAREEAMRARSS